MFDYNKLIKKYGICTTVVDKIILEVKEEFPNDEMMAELHIIRALRSYIKTLSKVV